MDIHLFFIVSCALPPSSPFSGGRRLKNKDLETFFRQAMDGVSPLPASDISPNEGKHHE